ncbi:hypothetical protein S479_22430 [Salmonella enterica subsp. enterica serovar Newport]|nr:hypothetical protein [Salmonella enterica subsp. enterica serovar Newport]
MLENNTMYCIEKPKK